MANILVVDDYSDTVESMAMWLKHYGHDVQVAHDGYQAIEIARRQPPNYVLLDLGLPGLDGYQVASRLRLELAVPRHHCHYGSWPGGGSAASTGGRVRPPFPQAGRPYCLGYAAFRVGNQAGLAHSRGFTPREISREDGPVRNVRRQVELINTLGLHLRAAEKFVRLCLQFQAGVQVACNGRWRAARVSST